jgi:hypothetical protein
MAVSWHSRLRTCARKRLFSRLDSWICVLISRIDVGPALLLLLALAGTTGREDALLACGRRGGRVVGMLGVARVGTGFMPLWDNRRSRCTLCCSSLRWVCCSGAIRADAVHSARLDSADVGARGGGGPGGSGLGGGGGGGLGGGVGGGLGGNGADARRWRCGRSSGRRYGHPTGRPLSSVGGSSPRPFRRLDPIGLSGLSGDSFGGWRADGHHTPTPSSPSSARNARAVPAVPLSLFSICFPP